MTGSSPMDERTPDARRGATQDTFLGAGKREPMLVSELLTEIRLANAPLVEQRRAVARWIAAGNTPNRMLALALRERGLPSPLAVDGEAFVRALGFDDIADEIADVKRRADTDPEDG